MHNVELYVILLLFVQENNTELESNSEILILNATKNNYMISHFVILLFLKRMTFFKSFLSLPEDMFMTK